MPHVLYYQQEQLKQTKETITAVDDVADEKRTNSIEESCSDETTVSAKNAAGSCQKEKQLRFAIFQQTLKDPVRDSHNPSTFPCSSDNDTDNSCQQQTNQNRVPLSGAKQLCRRQSLESKVESGAKQHCRRQTFEAKVEDIKEYIEKNGHMHITKEENEVLHNFIRDVKNSYKKQMKEGEKPTRVRLSQQRMEMLKGINFDFGRLQPRRCKSFQTFVTELKEYKEKHGHMNVTQEENQSLHAWIRNVNYNCKRVREGRTPRILLDPMRMRMLEDINFQFDIGPSREGAHYHSFKSTIEEQKKYIEKNCCVNVTEEKNKSLHLWIRYLQMQHVTDVDFDFGPSCEDAPHQCNVESFEHVKSFESFVKELREHVRRYGHMIVTEEQNKSLHAWVENVKYSLQRISRGQPPLLQLSQERMKMLAEFDLTFVTRQRRAVKYGQKRSHSSFYVETRHNTFRAPKIQRHEGTGQKMSPTGRRACSPTSELLSEGLFPRNQSCQSFESSVEETKISYEESDLAEQCEEQERVEIEGDLIPGWLLVGDEN